VNANIANYFWYLCAKLLQDIKSALSVTG